MTRRWALTVVALELVAMFAGALMYRGLFTGGSAVDGCGSRCAATASAVWFVWNELDCDDQPETVANCQDILEQKVVRAPTVGQVTSRGAMVTVPLAVAADDGQPFAREAVVVDTRTGEVVGSRSEGP